HIIPGSPAALMLGPEATTEQIDEVTKALGLDKPFLEQFYLWSLDLLKGDFGDSYFINRPVLSLIFEKMPVTISIAIIAELVAILLAVPLGVFSAVKHNTIYDQLFMIIAVFGVSIPSFWLGIMFILFFSVILRWFPVQGYIAINDSITGWIMHLFLPALALGFNHSGLIARITRSSMLEVLSADYIRTVRSKGLAEKDVVFKHALKNSMIPIVTVIGLSFTALLGGALIIETVFAMPGLGRLMLSSVQGRDYPVVQGTLIIFAIICVIMNLFIDIIYLYLDPRIKYN
ncbi:ABC transporter permease, partial [Candidatus Babeliales bacterium]|nr:ABC transporter permease [Candidatus Babeliales bacterium]